MTSMISAFAVHFRPSAVPLTLFGIAVGLVLYTYAGYPLLLAFVASMRRMPRRQPGYYPKITVLIAAYNEESNIGRKLIETLSLDYPRDRLEIIVVSDGSTDGTERVVEACTDPRVRLLRINDRRGKTHAQNYGVAQSRGDVIVFSDATATYHPQALVYLACNYEDATIGAVSGRYQYWDPEGDSPTGVGSATFWTYENVIKKLQSQIKTLTGCSGCIYSVRKSVYTPLPDNACSDLVEPLCVVQKGYRVAFEDRALAYEETTKSTGEEFTMRVRVVARGIRGLLSVPELLNIWRFRWVAFQLISHKLLRWLVPVCLILIFASTALLTNEPGFKYLFFGQVLFYGFALFTLMVPIHRYWRLLAVPLYFCTVNCAALVAMIEVVRGQKFVVWETVRK